MNKKIIHVDMDSFFVSVELLKRPLLRGNALVTGGSPEGRGVITCASYEARKYGVSSGMSARDAIKLCPKLIFLGSNHTDYSYYSELIYDIYEERVPIVEQASIDEFYLDVTGCERLLGDAFDFCTELKKIVKDKTSLPHSIGIAPNKALSKIASKVAKPDGIREVKKGEEIEFLKPLAIKYISGIGKKTAKTLTELGINTIGDLQGVQKEHLKVVFGKHGANLYYQARGMYESSVKMDTERKQISKERTFSADSSDLDFIDRKMYELVQKICFTLRERRKLAGEVTVKLRYSDFDTHTMTKKIFPTNFDDKVFEQAKILFRRLHKRRVRIRLIGVKLGSFSDEQLQLDWLDTGGSQKKDEFYDVMDKVRDKFGFDSIKLGL